MKTAKKILSLALSVGIAGTVFAGTLVQKVSASAEYTINFEDAGHKGYFEALGAESEDAWGIVGGLESSRSNGVGIEKESKVLKLTLNGDGTYKQKDLNLQESDRSTEIPYAIYRLNPYYTENLKSVSGKIGLSQSSAIGIVPDSYADYGHYTSYVIKLQNDTNKVVRAYRQKFSDYFWSTESTQGTTAWNSFTSYKNSPTGNDPVWISFKLVYQGTAAMLYYSVTTDIADKDAEYFENEDNAADFAKLDLNYSEPGFAMIVYADNGSTVLSERIGQSVAYLEDIKVLTDSEQRQLGYHTQADSKLPKVLTFENLKHLETYLLKDASDSKTVNQDRYMLSKSTFKVLGKYGGKFALKLGDKNSWFKIKPEYTDGKGYNTVTGKIGLRNGNDLCVIYNYTDGDNFKGFRLGNNNHSLYINTYEKAGGKSTEGAKVWFKTAQYVEGEHTESGIIQFFNFKISCIASGTTLTVTSSAYDSKAENVIIPECVTNGTELKNIAFWGCDASQYAGNGAKFIDDLKIYVEQEGVCIHNYTETLRTDADYLTAGEVIYKCSKCGETKSEKIYAYADFNKDGKVSEEDFAAFDENTADRSLFSFDGVEGISAFDKTVVKLLTKGIKFADMVDVNGDGKTDIIDLVRIKKIAAGLAEGDMDRNADGVKDGADIVFVRVFLLLFDQKLLK